jgi:hypothetical protein
VPLPDGIELPEKENAKTTPGEVEIVNPLSAASPPLAPSAQPSRLNWNP